MSLMFSKINRLMIWNKVRVKSFGLMVLNMRITINKKEKFLKTTNIYMVMKLSRRLVPVDK